MKALIHLLRYQRTLARKDLVMILHQLLDEGVAGAVGLLLAILLVQALQTFELTTVLNHWIRMVLLKKNKVT